MPRTKLPSTHDRIKRQLAKKPAGRDRVRQALCDLAGWLAEAPADLWKSFYPASFSWDRFGLD